MAVTILSETVHNKLEAMGVNIRKELESFILIGVVILAIMTGILTFWWQAMGDSVMVEYAHYWMKTYPNVPLTESATLQFIQIADIITQIFLIMVWVCIAIFVIIMALTDPKKQSPKSILLSFNKKQDQLVHIIDRYNNSKLMPLSKLKEYENKTVIKSQPKDCIWCGSKKIREAGKDHKENEYYCKTCRRFFFT